MGEFADRYSEAYASLQRFRVWSYLSRNLLPKKPFPKSPGFGLHLHGIRFGCVRRTSRHCGEDNSSFFKNIINIINVNPLTLMFFLSCREKS